MSRVAEVLGAFARHEAERRTFCELAVVTTAPGSRSQENMMKRGFALLYARAILVRGWEQAS